MTTVKWKGETEMVKGEELEGHTAMEVLQWGLDEYAPRIALASSFQVEASVLIDMLHRLRGSKFRVFTLDTGRLNQETYECMDAVRERYGIQIEVFFPDAGAVERMVGSHGLNLFYQSIEMRKMCCNIRKVEPLKRALSGLGAWITGLRREQSVTREKMGKVEIDTNFNNIIKINPLADWSASRVWQYIRENDIPYNKLHDRGFPSIGCAPCTRAVRPWEDIRAGRWWWENSESKECGLHSKNVEERMVTQSVQP